MKNIIIAVMLITVSSVWMYVDAAGGKKSKVNCVELEKTVDKDCTRADDLELDLLALMDAERDFGSNEKLDKEIQKKEAEYLNARGLCDQGREEFKKKCPKKK